MEIEDKQLTVNYKGNDQTLSYLFRPGSKETIMWLHGFACSYEDFRPAFSSEALADYTLIAFNFPGSPHSPYPKNESYNLNDLVEITQAFIEKLNLKDIIIVGHSVGSLIGNLLSLRYPTSIKSFVSVEGNMDQGDAWLTSKIVGNSYEKFVNEILPKYIHSLRASRIQIYGEHLGRANSKSCYDYAETVVKYSKVGLENFLNLRLPKLFIYSSENKSLPYLPTLKQFCRVAEIPNSNHWPTLDNPRVFFQVLSNFIEELRS